jgi:hypothetical protein
MAVGGEIRDLDGDQHEVVGGIRTGISILVQSNQLIASYTWGCI